MYISDKFKSISPSPTLAIDTKFKQMKADGMDVVGFGAGEPDFDTPQHIKDAAEGVYETLYISHGDCLADAEILRDEILKIAPFNKVVMGPIGPIVGASVGPGTVIAYCYGKEVTIEGNE